MADISGSIQGRRVFAARISAWVVTWSAHTTFLQILKHRNNPFLFSLLLRGLQTLGIECKKQRIIAYLILLTASEDFTSIGTIFSSFKIVSVASATSVRERDAHSFVCVEIPSWKVASTRTYILFLHTNGFQEKQNYIFITILKQ